MQILLINPKISSSTINLIKRYDRLRFYQFSYPYLLSMTPDEFKVDIFDEIKEVREIDIDAYRPDLVLMNGETSQVKRMYELAQQFRNQGAQVVLSGAHVSLFQEEAAQYADALILGEVEGHWDALLQDAHNKKLKSLYQTDKNNCFNLDELPYDLMKVKSSLLKIGDARMYPLLINRGRFQNAMTANAAPLSAPDMVRNRSLEKIEEEIKAVGNQVVFYLDGDLDLDHDFAASLFKILYDQNAKWITTCSASFLLDEKNLDGLVRSGCKYLAIKLDRSNVTDASEDGISAFGEYYKVLHTLQQYAILLFPIIHVGYDQDQPGIFDEVFSLVKQFAFNQSLVYLNAPLPGSTLYKEYADQSRIIEQNWDHYYGVQPVHQPKHMSVEELQEGYIDMMKRLTKLSHRLQITSSN